MNTCFNPHQTLIKPYALMDLDDTLFQTLRKIQTWQLPKANLTVATVNKMGEPLSFFTTKQRDFFDWLLQSTELIPITARDTQEIQRVKLPFNSWQVLTHGAVILQPDGQYEPQWLNHISTQLQPLQAVLAQMMAYLSDLNPQDNWVITPHKDRFKGEDLVIYLAVKHRHKQHAALATLAQQLTSDFPQFQQHFYVHVNANNLAILPHAVHKQHAVSFLQQQYLNSERASFGFGDSLADLPFLQLLDWYGTPSRGQLHDAISRGCV